MAKVSFVGKPQYRNSGEESLKVTLDLDFRPIIGDVITIELKHSYISYTVEHINFKPNGKLEVFGEFNYKKNKKD